MAIVRRLRDLETRLGHKFKDRVLLDLALTHSSVNSVRSTAARDDNERMEFLGDRVLGLVIAELLIERDPEAPEGALAQRYNRLVNGETCAAVARELDLGAHLRLSDSEAQHGGRDKTTILADACEALLAAVFLEAGFDKARRIIRQTTGVSQERATDLLEAGGNSVRTAIIMEKIKVSRGEAERLLAQAGGRIREALASFGQV